MLLNDEQYGLVWDKVYSALHFCPSTNTSIIPFKISVPYIVFNIREAWKTTDSNAQIITETFIQCLNSEERLYALDWHHSCFLFDPRDATQMESFFVEDARYDGGGYHAYFPQYYPNGDYYFFIDEKFRFGYLSHPWRKEIWIFGTDLIEKFKKIHKQLGWTMKEDHS